MMAQVAKFFRLLLLGEEEVVVFVVPLLSCVRGDEGAASARG